METTSIEFKSKCFELMDHVKESHEEVIITQDGNPIAKLVPYEEHEEKPVNLFGYMKGSVTINGDILEPIDEKWFADIELSSLRSQLGGMGGWEFGGMGWRPSGK